MGSTTGQIHTELTLPARPESVVIARRAVSELGRELAFSERRADDLRTVVSEACMNAAVHAYDAPGGEFEVRAAPDGGGIGITVSDRGTGIRPRPALGSPSARLGLLLIAALSDSVEISSRRGGGTQLSIRFS